MPKLFPALGHPEEQAERGGTCRTLDRQSRPMEKKEGVKSLTPGRGAQEHHHHHLCCLAPPRKSNGVSFPFSCLSVQK